MAPDDPRHGTVNGYVNLKCRCQPCRDAWAAKCRDLKMRRRSEVVLGRKIRTGPLVGEPVHGKASTYGNWGCRCDECQAAWTEAQHRWYPHRYKQAAS